MHKFITKTRKRFQIDQSALKEFDEKSINDIITEFNESCNMISEEEMKQNQKMQMLEDMKQEAPKETKEEDPEELPMNESIADDNENPQEPQEEEQKEEEEEEKNDEDEENKEAQEEEEKEEVVVEEVKKITYPLYQWNAKVARYLAYAVDGGILCSQFTLLQMITMMAAIQEAEDEKIIKKQILYMLHIRKIGESPKEDTSLTAELKAL